jgi:hypothetical protein
MSPELTNDEIPSLLDEPLQESDIGRPILNCPEG